MIDKRDILEAAKQSVGTELDLGQGQISAMLKYSCEPVIRILYRFSSYRLVLALFEE